MSSTATESPSCASATYRRGEGFRRIVAESADRHARRAAAAEISEILRRAESATA
jgi:hypothetical protein